MSLTNGTVVLLFHPDYQVLGKITRAVNKSKHQYRVDCDGCVTTKVLNPENFDNIEAASECWTIPNPDESEYYQNCMTASVLKRKRVDDSLLTEEQEDFATARKRLKLTKQMLSKCRGCSSAPSQKCCAPNGYRYCKNCCPGCAVHKKQGPPMGTGSSSSSNSNSNSSSSSSNNSSSSSNNNNSSSTPIDLTTNSGSSSNSSSSVNSTETERLAWLKEDVFKLDVKDTEDTWCVATVTTMKNHTSRTKKTQVFIHYDEYHTYDHTYDEWFLLTSKRIARFRSMTAWYCTPIMQINPDANRWKIKGRITNISNMKTWSNAKGDSKFAIKDA